MKNKIILQKIIDYCDKTEILIERFGATYEKFVSDFLEIAWTKIKGLRNIYAHDYESVNLKMIWEILTEDIPKLKEDLQKIYGRG